jgi:hypothetical protein
MRDDIGNPTQGSELNNVSTMATHPEIARQHDEAADQATMPMPEPSAYSTKQQSENGSTLDATPDYTFNLAPVTWQVDATMKIVSVGGNATLTDGLKTGTLYVIDRGTLNTDVVLEDVMAAWATESTAGRVYPILTSNPTIPAINFALVGATISSPVFRTLIVSRTTAGITSYQLFRVSFKDS